MKKILLIITLFTFAFATTQFSFAEGQAENVKVKVWTKVPWASCAPVVENWMIRHYECNDPKKTRWVIKMIWNIISYFTFITLVTWVLFIVVNWILYSMGWLDQQLKEDAKKRITWTLAWIILLFSVWYILQILVPSVYK